ncbi:GNAT family N-acetyltransferase [Legionella shakespearei]|uniref:Effector protein B, substrate of the Dot/Icm secretion system n=1 Tax=Legionella shakespearei DSM 23087 TaxID=1122169 RepID=A0A0W0YLE4_9GAMM|nr:N-acetyltransferase [Legionella shakespearei]KTD57655.1 effector protein B, substrate of the Dot/Icm secretion system [Legionella shakespearei DSM 23087]
MPIRYLTSSDKDQILALDKIIFNTVDPQGGWTDSDFDQFFNEESCYVFSDEEEPDAIIGYIFATQVEDHTYISNLGSDPRIAKRGVGTTLMERVMLQEFENSQKRNRPFSVKLHVDAHNAKAIQFYKNLGFKEESRDYYGIKMTATELPEKFKKIGLSSAAPILRKALIIRNVEGLQYDDLKNAMEGFEPDEQAPSEFNRLLLLMRATPSEQDRQEALSLFKREPVRDYVYKLVKEKTGSHIIYHMNGLEDGGRINASAVRYITAKLEAIPANTDFDLMYLGGGHGSPHVGSSNLTREHLEEITKIIHQKNIKCSAVILGSCFSSAYLGLYQPLLKPHGVTLSNSLECGGYNGFKQAMRWVKGQQNEFYSNEDIRGSILVSPEERDAFKHRIEEGLSEPEHTLLHAYTTVVHREIGALPEAEVKELAEELLHNNLIDLITDLHVLEKPLTQEKIQESLTRYPHLHDYIKAIVHHGDNSIFEILIHCIKPIPTSLALGTSTTLTLFKFSEVNTVPSSSADDYKRNYRAVLTEVELSGGFSEIREVLSGFNQISVKRQFNELFARATAQLANTRREELRQEQLGQEQLRQDSNQSQKSHKEEHHRIFKKSLKKLRDKAEELNRRGEPEAYSVALKLYKKLDKAGTIYFQQESSAEHFEKFKNKCEQHIGRSRNELDKHRGWSEFLFNFLLAIGTLGIGLVVKGAINLANNRSFFFVHQTDTSKKLDEIEEVIIQSCELNL